MYFAHYVCIYDGPHKIASPTVSLVYNKSKLQFFYNIGKTIYSLT